MPLNKETKPSLIQFDVVGFLKKTTMLRDEKNSWYNVRTN